ncbi:MAG: LptF/LptG family permease [Phycisphaeraceae bacterium]|nr:LptF/LptG family permease [Phycisphaerales bacterium]MCB9841990.1 LptF/LptG family permease [Phycisphaeraceae bacterium]
MSRMFRRVPILIWRSITGEMLRLLIVSAASLVGVIAFAVAVKPLSEGQVGASAAMMFMTLAMVPMLQYALPFAGGFAATLAYHRMSSDNEGVAAMAGGVGPRRILLPAVVVGVALAVLVGVLSNTLMPRFFHAMERVLTRDAASIVASAVGDGQSVVLGDRKRAHWQVFARQALELPAEGDARNHLVLMEVLAVDVARDGIAQNYISAERVDAWFFDDNSGDEPGTAVQLRFSNALRTGQDGAVYQEAFVTQRVRIPGAIRDDPKFLTWTQMDEAAAHPERMGPVEQRRRVLAQRLADLGSARRIATMLRQSGQAEFVARDGQVVRVFGDDLQRDSDSGNGGWTVVSVAIEGERSGRIRIERVGEGGVVTLMTAGGASIQPDRTTDAPGGVSLRMNDVLTAGREGVPGTRRDEVELPGLWPRGNAGEAVMAMSADDLLNEARLERSTGAGDPGVSEAARELRQKTRDFRREVLSKRHERLGYAAACFVMVLAGAVMGMRLRESLPLPVYLWSFFPALIAVITVSAGQGVTHKTGEAGLVLLWGGVAGLAAFTYSQYRKLSAH